MQKAVILLSVVIVGTALCLSSCTPAPRSQASRKLAKPFHPGEPDWTAEAIPLSGGTRRWGVVKRFGNGLFAFRYEGFSFYNGWRIENLLNYPDTNLVGVDLNDRYIACALHTALANYQLKQELLISEIEKKGNDVALVHLHRFDIPFSQSITGIKFLNETQILITSFLEYGIVDIEAEPNGDFDISFKHYPFLLYNTQGRLEVAETYTGRSILVFGGLGVNLLQKLPNGGYGLREMFYYNRIYPDDAGDESYIGRVAMVDTSFGVFLLGRSLVYYDRKGDSSNPIFVARNYLDVGHGDSISAKNIVDIKLMNDHEVLCLTSNGLLLEQELNRNNLPSASWEIVKKLPEPEPINLTVLNDDTVIVATDRGLVLIKRSSEKETNKSAASIGSMNPVFVGQRSAQPTSGYGVGIGDLDNDGTNDIYLVDVYDANRLFTSIPNEMMNAVTINLASERGIAGRVSKGLSGTPFYSLDLGVAIGDVNEDGAEDLIVTNLAGSNSLFLNNGRGYFKDATGDYDFNANMWRSEGAVLGDVDDDGYLDVFCTSFYKSNRLFANDHGISLNDVTGKYGLSSNGRSISAVFGDVNNDGYLDLYVGNWMKQNKLFINEGNGKFVDRTKESGVGCGDIKETNSVLFADFNNDGYLDLFVGNRGGGDKLFLNNGNGTFRDVTKEAGLAGDYHTYGAVFGDFDNDGWQDIAITCLGGVRIFKNLGVDSSGQIHFRDVTSECFDASDIQEGYNTGLATADFGNKGFLDLVMNQNGGYTYFLMNMTALNGHNNYLSVKVKGDESNRDAIGATLKLFYGDSLLGYREISGGFGYASSSSRIQHFGLGGLKGPFSLVVYFPMSHVTRTIKVNANSFITVSEHSGLRQAFFLARKYIFQLIYGKGFIVLGGEILLLLILLLGLTSFAASRLKLRRKEGKGNRVRWPAVLLGFAVFYAIKIVSLESMSFYFGPAYFIVNSTNLFTDELLPLLGACLFAVAYLLFVRSKEARSFSGYNVLDNLLTALKRFDHGEGMLIVLYRLSLLVENLTRDGTEYSQDGLERIRSAYSEYTIAVHPEIQSICGLLSQIEIRKSRSHMNINPPRIADSLLSSDEQVLGNCESLLDSSSARSKDKPRENIIFAVKKMRETLTELRTAIRSNFSVDVCKATELAVKKFQEQRPNFTIECAKSVETIGAVISSVDLNEVLNIIIQNAVDEINQMGISQGIIRISTGQRDGMAEIRIEDNGRGISPELREKIFNGGITTKRQGHGMGLSIARKCLEKYDGKISCGNGTLGGAAFAIELKSI